jgi:hypothetical protein
MPQPRLLNQHQILPVERVRNTLIITPAGDIVSFRVKDFRRELEAIRQSLRQDADIDHVIISLDGGTYFSAPMLDQLRELETELKGRGELLVCGASDELKSVLQRLRRNTPVSDYRTTASALSGVTDSQLSGAFYATRTAARPYARLFYWAGGIALVVLLGFVGRYLVFGTVEQRDYNTLRSMWLTTVRLRQKPEESFALKEHLRWSESTVREILHRNREQSKKSPAADDLYSAAIAMQQNLITRSGNDQTQSEFLRAMDSAAEKLGCQPIETARANTTLPGPGADNAEDPGRVASDKTDDES